MIETTIKTMAGYFRLPILEHSRMLRRWVMQVWAKRRLQRLIKSQEFPRRVETILVVCKGNICRSPLAEAYLRQRLIQCGQSVLVFSAGLETSLGRPAHTFAQTVGRSAGICLDGHATKPLLREHVERADLIVVMEHTHYYRLIKLYPNCLGKTFLLRQFSSTQCGCLDEMEIADPYSGTLNDFQECFAVIRQSCDQLMNVICRINGNAPLVV